MAAGDVVLYPDGVQVRGNLVVDGLYVRGNAGFGNGLTAPDLFLAAAVEPPVEPPIVTPGEPLPGGGGPTLRISEAIETLQSQIKQLQDRVAALEGVSRYHP